MIHILRHFAADTDAADMLLSLPHTLASHCYDTRYVLIITILHMPLMLLRHASYRRYVSRRMPPTFSPRRYYANATMAATYSVCATPRYDEPLLYASGAILLMMIAAFAQSLS